jgi:hypothetical protein
MSDLILTVILLLPFAAFFIFIIWVIILKIDDWLDFSDSLGEKLPYHPRILNCVFACIFSYFWLPCPLCGKKFGGHEWTESINTSFASGQGVCPRCIEEAKKINELNRPQFNKDMEEHYGKFNLPSV